MVCVKLLVSNFFSLKEKKKIKPDSTLVLKNNYKKKKSNLSTHEKISQYIGIRLDRIKFIPLVD